MEDAMIRRRPIPSFGNWDYCEELPITQYFESASHAGLLRPGYAGRLGGGPVGGGHLYPPPLPHYYYYHHHHHHPAQAVEEDLFKVPAAPPVVVTAYPRKVRKGTTLEKQLQQQRKRLQQQQQQVREEEAPPQQQLKKQGRVCDCDVGVTQQPRRRPKAVDEDLYKIPPELLYQKPRRKKTPMSEFLSRCLGLNCIP